MSKCPYAFTARSRAAMTAYLLDRKPYYDQGATFPFSWNVKAYHVNCEHPQGEKHSPALDAKWAAYIGDNWELYNLCVEDAQHYYAAPDNEWTSYPGADQGDWQFGFYGRSAGHMCLEQWRGHKLYGRGVDVAEWCAGLSFAELRAFYRGIVCADRDFTPAKASANIEHQVAFQRMLWEEEQEAEQECEARQQEASRPDLYVIR